jgi:hypothetical protein
MMTMRKVFAAGGAVLALNLAPFALDSAQAQPAFANPDSAAHANALNAQINAGNAAVDAANRAAQDAYAAQLAARQAQIDEQQRQYQAQVAAWQAQVAACKAGDRSQCAQGGN